MLYNRGHDPEYKLYEFFDETFGFAGEFLTWDRKSTGVEDDSSVDYVFYVELNDDTETEDFCALMRKQENVSSEIIADKDVSVSVHVPENEWMYEKLLELGVLIRNNTVRGKEFMQAVGKIRRNGAGN